MTIFEAIRTYFKMKKIWEVFMLKGYKTYIVGLGMILYGVGGLAAGIHDWDTASQFVLNGLAFMGLRAGVSSLKTNGGVK